jgi:putative Holliday junction resolvase
MNKENKRILAVDPGEKNIGIAVSDPGGLLARPLMVLKHVSMLLDSAQIVSLAEKNQAGLIIVGLPTGPDNEDIPQTRHARKLMDSIKTQTKLSVLLWDEWGSTKRARNILLDTGVSRTKRSGHQDALAAAVILQSYLDDQSVEKGQDNE